MSEPDTDFALINSVLTAIKSDDTATLSQHLQTGVDKNIQFPPELQGEHELFRNGTPLTCAAAFFGSSKCLDFLLANGASPTGADDDGFSAVYYAAAAGNFDILLQLLSHGFDGRGCGQAAIKYNRLSFFENAVARSIINLTDTDFNGSTFLHVAAFDGNREFVQYLLSLPNPPLRATDREGRTPLHLSAGNGFVDISELLLRAGADPSQLDRYGKPAVYYAASQEQFPVVELILGRFNELGQDGFTPLMRATVYGRLPVLELLLNIELVNPNLGNREGLTALHLAIKNDQPGMMKVLLESEKVDVNAADLKGRTPLHWAAKKGAMAALEALLRSRRVNSQIRNNAGKTALEKLNEKVKAK
jgi:ankyrin repeat protein